MKTKKFKRFLTLVLALAMMLSLSMVSFATGSVTLYCTVPDNTGTPVTTYVGTYNLDANNNTVYDILSQLNTTWSSEYNAVAAYSPLYGNYDPDSALIGKYNYKVNYLRYYNSLGSTGYEPITGALDPDDYYIPTQTVDSTLMAADAALSEYGGLDYWLGDGYGIAADWVHMVYIGWDWEFTVNYSKPGIHFDTPDPDYGNDFQFTMRESLLTSGDRIDLNYVSSFYVFDPAES